MHPTHIRRVRPHEAERLRTIRLRALLTDPTAFTSAHHDEAARGAEAWEIWAAAASVGGDQTVFVAEVSGDLVGMAGGYRATTDPRELRLIALWVEPAYRRRGIGRALTEAVIDWARRSDADRLTLWVTEANRTARRLYATCGFTPTETTRPLPSHPDQIERLLTLPIGGRMRLPAGYVELVPMAPDEFDAYLIRLLSERAGHAGHSGGSDAAAADAAAQQEILARLELGLSTPGHHIDVIRAGMPDGKVGWAWYGVRERGGEAVAMIYDLFVFTGWRRRGIATAALDEIARWAQDSELTAIVAEVPEADKAAHRVLAGAGFVEVGTSPGIVVRERRPPAPPVS